MNHRTRSLFPLMGRNIDSKWAGCKTLGSAGRSPQSHRCQDINKVSYCRTFFATSPETNPTAVLSTYDEPPARVEKWQFFPNNYVSKRQIETRKSLKFWESILHNKQEWSEETKAKSNLTQQYKFCSPSYET